jgi:hypothetical protein
MRLPEFIAVSVQAKPTLRLVIKGSYASKIVFMKFFTNAFGAMHVSNFFPP